jgi:hypothetical protein
MKGGCHMSYMTIQQFFKEVMHLYISRGMLSKAAQKTSQSPATVYNQLTQRLPKRIFAF